jgi:hypothetical protein
VGTLNLRIPKLRTGSFFEDVLECHQCVDRAPIVAVAEMHATGTSTRKAQRIRCNNRRSSMRVSTQTPIAVCDLPTLLGCPGAWRTCRFPPTKKKPGKALPLRPSWPNLAQLRLHTINSFSDLRVHGLDGAIFQLVSKTRPMPPDNGVS